MRRSLEPLLFATLAAALFGLRFLSEPGGWITDEELHSPSVAALLAGGRGWGQLPPLQYASFCGGCTVETLMVTPLTAAVGPALWAWKLVPLLFAATIVGLTWVVGRAAGGPTAARVAAAAMLAAPLFYAHNAMVAFGSHVEVMAFVLAAVWRWHHWLAQGRLRDAATVGLLCGLGAWFSYTGAFAAPVLLLAWAGLQPRQLRSLHLPVFVAGVLLGLCPWALTQAGLYWQGAADGPLVGVYGMGPADLLDQAGQPLGRLWLAVGRPFWVSALHPVFSADRPLPGLAWTAAAWAAWLVALGLALRRPREQATALAVALLLPAYLGLFVFLGPVRGGPDPDVLAANAMRYLTPLVPLLALSVGIATARLSAMGGPARLAAAALVLGTVGVAGTAQLGAVRPDDLTTRPLYLSSLDASTVAFRLRVDLGQPQDPLAPAMDAALASLSRREPARGIQLRAIGRALGNRIAIAADDGGRRADGPWLDGLAPSDRLRLWQGVAEELAGQGGWFPSSVFDGPDPRLAKMLAELEEDDAVVLVEALMAQDRGVARGGLPALASGEALPALAALAGSQEGAAWATGVAWGMGNALADDEVRGAAAPAELRKRVAQHAALLDPGLRAAFLRGAGTRLGARWGHDPATRAALLEGLAPADGDALAAGFAAGAADGYWWPRAVEAPERPR